MAGTDPKDKLKETSQDLLKALGEKAMGTVTDKVGGLTDKLEDIAGGGPIGKAVARGGAESAKGGSAVGGAVKGAVEGVKDKITGGGGGKGSPKATKATNIIETIDVGVPVTVAYNQWTEFGAFPSFMKKVENVEAQDDNKVTFKAQIFLSHRTWEATILEQIPDERIVWRSKGAKGHVDGAVTFHEIGPNLTRILVVLEYYPQGLFEKTGNIWEAQGRRARAEIRHFRRHVMTRTILDQDEAEGWRGRIEDGEVVETHEEAVEREEQEQDEQDRYDESGEDSGDEAEDEAGEDEAADDEEEPADGSEEDEGEEDEADEEPESEYEDEEPADEESEGEYEDEEPADEESEGEYEDEEPADEESEGEYEEEEPADDVDEYDEVDEDEAEPEDEEAEDEEAEDEEAEDDYEEPVDEEAEDAEPEEDESEEEPEEQPRRRRRRAS